MRGSKLFRQVGYIICLGLIVAIVLSVLLGLRPSAPDRYSSVHPAGTMPPLWGMSEASLLNQGDAKALDRLPGVGEVISQRIIDTREMIGGFRVPEDLMLVKGIGEKTFAKIMDALGESLVQLMEIAR